jgi:hypothetical protein
MRQIAAVPRAPGGPAAAIRFVWDAEKAVLACGAMSSVAAGLRPLLALTLGLGLWLASARASGQTDEQRSAARALATEGAAAFNEGRYKDAIDYFGKAESLVHAPPHLLFLARSHAKLGQLVVAREAYLKIIKETFPANAPQAFRDAQASAAEEVKAIEPRIGTLTVRVEGAAGATDTAVLLDGTPMPSILIGAPRPTDPGEHKLEAGATGLRSAPTTIVVGDGERKSVTLLLQPAPGAPPLVVAPDAAPPPAPAARTSAPAATTASPTSDAGTASDKSALRIGSYVAFGVGVLGVGAGTLFTLQSSGKRSDADEKFEECGGATGCTQENPLSQEVEELDRDADSALTLGIVGFAVGGVGLATGAVLFVLSTPDKKTAAGVEPWVGLGSAGLRGRF